MFSVIEVSVAHSSMCPQDQGANGKILNYTGKMWKGFKASELRSGESLRGNSDSCREMEKILFLISPRWPASSTNSLTVANSPLYRREKLGDDSLYNRDLSLGTRLLRAL